MYRKLWSSVVKESSTRREIYEKERKSMKKREKKERKEPFVRKYRECSGVLIIDGNTQVLQC